MIIHSNFLSFQIGSIMVPKNIILVCIGAGDVLERFSSFVAILPNLRFESHEQMEVPVSTKSAQRTAQLEQIKDAMKGDKRLFWLLALEAKSLLALIWYTSKWRSSNGASLYNLPLKQLSFLESSAALGFLFSSRPKSLALSSVQKISAFNTQ